MVQQAKVYGVAATAAQIQSLAWELPYDARATIKKKKSLLLSSSHQFSKYTSFSKCPCSIIYYY